MTAGLASRRHRAGIENASEEFRQCDSDLIPHPSFQRAVILCAAEDVANEVAESWGIVQQLNHARRDCSTEEISAEEFLCDAGGEFQVCGKSGTQSLWIRLRNSVNQ